MTGVTREDLPVVVQEGGLAEVRMTEMGGMSVGFSRFAKGWTSHLSSRVCRTTCAKHRIGGSC